jgi:hypothetical protein
MGAFTAVTLLQENNSGSTKTRIFSALGPASYDAGGSVIDLSSATLGGFVGFSEVYCGQLAGIAAASTKYQCVFVPAAAGAAATGKIKIHDSSAAADAEASGDLSAVTFYFRFEGR